MLKLSQISTHFKNPFFKTNFLKTIFGSIPLNAVIQYRLEYVALQYYFFASVICFIFAFGPARTLLPEGIHGSGDPCQLKWQIQSSPWRLTCLCRRLHLSGVPLKSLEVLLSTAGSLDAAQFMILSATCVSEAWPWL